MTRADAVALSQALETALVPHSIVLSFPSPGVEQWNVDLDPTRIYNGAQIGQLANYCAAHGLTLSVQVQMVGVV